MAAADNNDIKLGHAPAVSSLFHVEHSFSDAEFAKQGIKHCLDADFARYSRQCGISAAQGISDHEFVSRAHVCQGVDGGATMVRLPGIEREVSRFGN
jgi:hypothetical protein